MTHLFKYTQVWYYNTHHFLQNQCFKLILMLLKWFLQFFHSQNYLLGWCYLKIKTCFQNKKSKNKNATSILLLKWLPAIFPPDISCSYHLYWHFQTIPEREHHHRTEPGLQHAVHALPGSRRVLTENLRPRTRELSLILVLGVRTLSNVCNNVLYPDDHCQPFSIIQIHLKTRLL